MGHTWAYCPTGTGTVDIGHFHVSAVAHQSVQGVHQSPFLSSAQRFHVSPHLHFSTAKAGPLIIISTVAPVFHRLVGMLEKELASLGFDQVGNSGLAFNF